MTALVQKDHVVQIDNYSHSHSSQKCYNGLHGFGEVPWPHRKPKWKGLEFVYFAPPDKAEKFPRS